MRTKSACRLVGAGMIVVAGMLSLPGSVLAQGGRFAVTVTNLTNAQTFTPILVASHKAGVSLFDLGSPASPELATIAEEGNAAPLMALLSANPDVREVVSSGALLPAGQSTTVMVEARGNVDHLSMAAMLIPTNDAFFSLNGVEGPRDGRTLTLFSPAYDSGSEVNDELCSSIPGPTFVECGGPGGGAAVVGGEEGYVHIHRGIHGVGDMVASERDWRNPVARIVIRRVK